MIEFLIVFGLFIVIMLVINEIDKRLNLKNTVIVPVVSLLSVLMGLVMFTHFYLN
jgi:glucan phosphoethanolaminetransferase (alkaline phosphatase superfamily)